MKKTNLLPLVLLLSIVACNKNGGSKADPAKKNTETVKAKEEGAKKTESSTSKVNKESETVETKESTSKETSSSETTKVDSDTTAPEVPNSQPDNIVAPTSGAEEKQKTPEIPVIANRLQKTFDIKVKDCSEKILETLDLERDENALALILEGHEINEISCVGSEFKVGEGVLELPSTEIFNYSEIDLKLGELLINSLNTVPGEYPLPINFVPLNEVRFSDSTILINNFVELIDWTDSLDKEFNRKIYLAEETSLQVDLSGSDVINQQSIHQFKQPIVSKVNNLSKSFESVLALNLGVKEVAFDLNYSKAGVSTVCPLNVASEIVSVLGHYTDEADFSNETIRFSHKDYTFKGGYAINCSTEETISESIKGLLDHYNIEDSFFNWFF